MIRRLSFILVFLALAPWAYGVAGCGAGTDNSLCGDYIGSDPYEGGTFDPTGKTALATCLNPLVQNTSYYLTSDVGADPTAICFGLRNGVTLDLRGFAVTGRLDMTGLNANGITIFNGIVNCSITPVPAACIKISSGSAYTAKTRLHHLTVHNSADPGTGAFAAILFDWSGLDGANTAIEVDHVTGYVGTATTSSRAVFLRLNTAKKSDIHDNDLTCNADTNACNLIEAVPAAGYVNGTIHNNNLTITTNTVPGGSPRAITISGPDSGSTGTQGWLVYNNYCTANNGRCFRFRQVNNLTVHDNAVINCAASTGYGCYHFADPSGGTSYVGDAQTIIYNENIGMAGGTAFWIRDGFGYTVQNSTVTGASGQLAQVLTGIQAPPGGPVPTGMATCEISGASSLGTASVAQVSTNVSTHNSANWSGAGTINDPGSCSPAPPPSASPARVWVIMP